MKDTLYLCCAEDNLHHNHNIIIIFNVA